MFPVNDHDPIATVAARVRYTCPRCGGRGWLPPTTAGDWPITCGLCKGRASFSSFSLGRLIGEAPSTIERLDDLRVRPSTAARLLPKFTDLR